MAWNELKWDEIISRIKSHKVTGEDLATLASNREDIVREVVALHPDTPDTSVEALCRDESFSVRENANVNRHLPQDWQRMYNADKIRALKSNDIDEKIIKSLAASEDHEIRQAIAWSPSTPSEIIESLALDKSEDVRYAAIQEQILPVEWRFKPWMHRANDLLANQNLDGLTDKMYEVLLHSPKASYSMHNADTVRRALSLCAKTPKTVLDILKDDPDKGVQSGLRERQLPDDWIKTLNTNLEDIVRKIKQAKNDMQALEVFSNSHHWELREAVARNASTAQNILEKLAADTDSEVAEIAIKQLKKRFPESKLLETFASKSSEDSDGSYLSFIINVNRAQFSETHEYWGDEGDDDDDALEAQVTGKATGEMRFDTWDLQSIKEILYSEDIRSFTELQNAFKRLDDSAWSEQIGQLDQEIISSELPGDEADSNLISATIQLDNNIQELSVESHLSGERSVLAAFYSNGDTDLYAESQSGGDSMTQNDMLLFVIATIRDLLNSIP